MTPATVPSAPAAPGVVRGNGSVAVTWVAPVTGGSPINGYTATAYAGSVGVRTCTTTGALSCTISGLSNGLPYTVKVKAANAVGAGAESVASSSVTPATVPSAPAAPGVVRGNGSVAVTWVAPANGGSAITGYSATAYSGSVVRGSCVASGSARTCTITGLVNGTTYTVRVKAANIVGRSVASLPSSPISPGSASTVPSAPAKPGVARGNGSVAVTWVAPVTGGSAITGYTATAYEGSVAIRTCTTTGALSCTISGLVNGTAYTVKVKAANAVGAGAESVASSSVTPATVPSAPAVPGVVGGNGSIAVTWVAPATGGSAITGYSATAYSNSVALGSCATSGSARTCTITGLVNGTTYVVRVKAANIVGRGGASLSSILVTPLST